MYVRDILRWFQNFRMRKTITQPVKRELLEEIVVRPIEHITAAEPSRRYPTVVEPVNVEVIAQPKIESPTPALYGEALRRHMSIPNWFYDSQEELKKLGVHGEAQVAGARVSTSEQIRAIYFRLERIFEYDTRSFVTYVPSVFTYKNNYLENYIRKLRDVSDLSREKFGYVVPAEFDWKKNPALYSSIEGLVNLEARLRNFEKDRTANQVEQNLEAYAGKRIFLIGIRTHKQEDILKHYLPHSTLIFNRGEDIKGLTKELPDYDVIVHTGGAATHKIDQRLKAVYGTDFSGRRVNAIGVINPDKVLAIMAQNSYRFK